MEINDFIPNPSALEVELYLKLKITSICYIERKISKTNEDFSPVTQPRYVGMKIIFKVLKRRLTTGLFSCLHSLKLSPLALISGRSLGQQAGKGLFKYYVIKILTLLNPTHQVCNETLSIKHTICMLFHNHSLYIH